MNGKRVDSFVDALLYVLTKLTPREDLIKLISMLTESRMPSGQSDGKLRPLDDIYTCFTPFSRLANRKAVIARSVGWFLHKTDAQLVQLACRTVQLTCDDDEAIEVVRHVTECYNNGHSGNRGHGGSSTEG